MTVPAAAGIYGRMDGRSATLAALGIAIAAIVSFFVLDGVTAGLVLFVAGVLLVVIGIFGWQDRAPAVATASAARAAAAAAALGGAAMPDDVDDAVEESVDELDAAERDRADAAFSTAEDDRPFMEEATAPHPAVGVTEAVTDPLGMAGAQPDPDPELGEVPDVGDRRSSEPDDEAPPAMMQVVEGDDTADHVHDQPLLGHSDLVAHARDYHPAIATDGSTIQLRLLHERAHGAPHETPPTLRPH